MPVRPVYWYDVTDMPEQLILLLRCMGSGFLAMVIKSCLLTKHEHYSENIYDTSQSTGVVCLCSSGMYSTMIHCYFNFKNDVCIKLYISRQNVEQKVICINSTMLKLSCFYFLFHVLFGVYFSTEANLFLRIIHPYSFLIGS